MDYNLSIRLIIYFLSDCGDYGLIFHRKQPPGISNRFAMDNYSLAVMPKSGNNEPDNQTTPKTCCVHIQKVLNST
jgi:hypothetical protein